MSSIQRARIQKTRFWFSDRDGFLQLLTRDLEKVQRLAKNTASWPRSGSMSSVISHGNGSLDLTRFPDIQFYDYSKVLARLGRTPVNYYLTFSRSETNEPQARQALTRGFNVAVPFRDPPASFLGHPVIDGDTHDYRFLDPRPVVVGLKPKGLARDDTTGFVREKCAIYARVSTADQSTEPQLLDLKRYTLNRGWELYEEYRDEGISGALTSRPA